MAVNTTNLTSGTRNWANADLQHVTATGRLSPRLGLTFKLSTPTERIHTELHNVRIQVHCENELLGEGMFIGEMASTYGNACQIEVPVAHQMLDYATSRLGAHADISLKLLWTGIMRVKWTPGDSDPKMQSDPEPDTWTQLTLNHTEQLCTIARSDWYSKVLQPIRQSEFIYLEIAVPTVGDRAQWLKTFDHLSDADKAFAMGDDAGVFAKLRAAVEALPGYPNNIVASLAEPQRSEVDTFLKGVSRYLHSGRHVSKVGESAGSFPVDCTDAYFALSAMKVVLSYLSKIVTND